MSNNTNYLAFLKYGLFSQCFADTAGSDHALAADADTLHRVLVKGVRLDPTKEGRADRVGRENQGQAPGTTIPGKRHAQRRVVCGGSLLR
jgi:hypothetical protein